jgi:signal transduction histidine kinase
MGAGIYKKFVASHIKDSDQRNREIVLNALLLCTFVLLALFLVALLVIGIWNNFHWGQIAATAAVLAFIGILYYLARTGRFRLTALLLVALYFFLGAAVIVYWGLFATSGILLFGLAVVLAGILLGAVRSLYALAAATITMLAVFLIQKGGFLTPNLPAASASPGFTDVFGFTIILGAIALVSWLFNLQMERSLRQAKRAEAALSRQKALLEVKVEERTRQLQAAQMEEMQQMYRFAELGQLSTAMLHDLANHLTTLTLDIEGLEEKTNSRLVRRAKRSMRYIDDMVNEVRDQLQGTRHKRSFSVASEIEEVIKILNSKAGRAHVALAWESQPDKSLRSNGEPVRFRQLIANLVSNGIDAYPTSTHSDPDKRRVAISLSVDSSKRVVIKVSDWGRGINAQDRARIFDPFYSTKTKGMGIGLFIARQIVEEHLGGSIAIDGHAQHTVFIVTLKGVS